MNRTDPRSESEPRSNIWKWALTGFLAVAAFFLWTEHRAHVLGVLPYLLLLACPLMHMFMHHGHGHSQHRSKQDATGQPPAARSQPGEQP